MATDPLDNPMWNALTTMHAQLAEAHGALRRYPRDVAPFLAAPGDGALPPADVEALVRPDETMIGIGVEVQPPPGWALRSFTPLLQMVCEGDVELPAGPPIVPLDETHRPAILALTARVYPHYFRARTVVLGRYFGIFEEGGGLVAMAGERMGMPGLREISAVCCYPEYAGRGHARRLLNFLARDIRAGGAMPFLHVAVENERARRLYEQNGWRVRKTLPFWALSAQP